MEKDVIKTGLAGFGLSGQCFHAPFLVSNSCYELVSVLERSGEKSKKLYPWVKIVKDFDQLVSSPDIDLIILSTPNETHYPFAKKALEAGKHVVVEKPFANSLHEALELADLSDKKKKKLSVYQNRRWDGDFLTVQEIVKNDFLGKLLEVESRFDRYRPEPKKNSWRENEHPGSGLLFDLGPHLIDQMIYLFGKPLSVGADIMIQRPGAVVDDAFEVRLYYKEMKAVLKAGNLVSEKEPRFLLRGLNGTYVKFGMDVQEENLRLNKIPEGENWGREARTAWGNLDAHWNGMRIQGGLETKSGSYQEFYRLLAEAILKDKPVPVAPADSALTIDIIEKAFQSSAERKNIKID